MRRDQIGKQRPGRKIGVAFAYQFDFGDLNGIGRRRLTDAIDLQSIEIKGGGSGDFEYAPLLALRFNLEEAPSNRFAVAVADRLDLAMQKAERLPDAPPCPALDDARSAVRDVMGWNTIWDGVNHRPYITCSRNWDLKKFGGFGFWLNDTAVNALLVSPFDADQARECLAAASRRKGSKAGWASEVSGIGALAARSQAV